MVQKMRNVNNVMPFRNFIFELEILYSPLLTGGKQQILQIKQRRSRTSSQISWFYLKSLLRNLERQFSKSIYYTFARWWRLGYEQQMLKETE